MADLGWRPDAAEDRTPEGHRPPRVREVLWRQRRPGLVHREELRGLQRVDPTRNEIHDPRVCRRDAVLYPLLLLAIRDVRLHALERSARDARGGPAGRGEKRREVKTRGPGNA